MTDAMPAPPSLPLVTSRAAAVIVMGACAKAAAAYARHSSAGGYVGAPTRTHGHAGIIADLASNLPDGPGLVLEDRIDQPTPGHEGLYWVVQAPRDDAPGIGVMLVEVQPGTNDTPAEHRILALFIQPVTLRRSMAAGPACGWVGRPDARVACSHEPGLPAEPITDPHGLGIHAQLARELLTMASRAINSTPIA